MTNKSMAYQSSAQDLVSEYAGLIKKIALQLRARLPATVEFDDLLQSGLIGLLEAHQQFKADKGASFATFAAIKIHGAMVDGLRKSTGITRDISQNIKKIQRAKTALENRDGDIGTITAKDVAQEMNISIEQYYKMQSEIQSYKAASYVNSDELEAFIDTQAVDPGLSLEQNDTKMQIIEIIANFPKRDQILLALYYNEQLTFREIAEVLSITEARVSQLHKHLVEHIKERCKKLAIYDASF